MFSFDLSNIFASGSLLEIIFRTAFVYTFLLVALRLRGKRELGQLNPFDLVLILVLSNAVQNAMVGTDTSLTGGIVAALVLLGINWLLSYVGERNATFEQMLEGMPTPLVHNGELLMPHLLHEGLTETDVEEALREHGIADLGHCQSAVLEVDGSISVISCDDVAKVTNLPMRQHVKKMRRFTKHTS